MAPQELDTSSGNDQEVGNGLVAGAAQLGYPLHWAQVGAFRLTLSEAWGFDLWPGKMAPSTLNSEWSSS